MGIRGWTMNDLKKKKDILTGWWAEFIPTRSTLVFNKDDVFNPISAFAILKQHAPQTPSIYVLFAGADEDAVPVYIGKAENPVVRWKQHLDGWAKGAGSYAKWRSSLLDAENKAIVPLSLLVVPLDSVTRPPIDGFPTTMGSLEYQLISLAEAVYPGRLFNTEGKSR